YPMRLAVQTLEDEEHERQNECGHPNCDKLSAPGYHSSGFRHCFVPPRCYGDGCQRSGRRLRAEGDNVCAIFSVCFEPGAASRAMPDVLLNCSDRKSVV